MPTYSYACTSCDERFDVVQSFTDDALTVCPACGERLRKVFHPVGVVFKGSGFYKTDSRGKSSSTAPSPKKDDAAASTSSDSTSDTKSDSSAAKVDAKPESSSSKSDTPSAPATKTA